MNKNANSSHEIEDRVLAGWLGDSPPGRPVEPDEALAMLDGLWAEGPSESALDEMRASLGDWWAGQTGTIFYDWLSAPIGRVYVAASQVGVLSVDFNQESDSAFFDHLINRHLKNQNVRLVHAPERLESVVQQLREYFAGQRDEFDFSADLRHLTAFQRDVLQAANQIPRGQIATYKEIAQRIGKPKASRAVGNALGRNPVPILIPCHRVVTKSGALGGYSGTGGPGTKSRLLELEGVVPDHRGHYALSA